MIALISFLAILFLSMTVVRIATIMLRLTGLSHDIAQFQARSAFTTTGFTAQESEIIMSHPMRRRIIQNLMVMGNVGFVSFISSLLLTLLSENDSLNVGWRLSIIAGGSLVLLVLTRMPFFDTIIGWFVRAAFRNDNRLYRKDYDSLLFLAKDFEIVKVRVRPESWLADRALKDLALADEGILVIGINRADSYFIGSPRGDSVLFAGDHVTLYGRESVLMKLAERPAGDSGDEDHNRNVEERRKLEGRLPDTAAAPARRRTGPRGLFHRRETKRGG